ncbi:MAG: response regulator transcription factor [Clostridia bacterium]|nr:response regulator transcription factor [Clostridia bacterium]
MKKIKLMICDDMSGLITYFKRVINIIDDMEIVATANNEESCISGVEHYRPDVLLLDIQLEENDTGVRILRRIKERGLDVKVIMLTIHEEDKYIFECLTLGAADYMLKTSPIKTILVSIRNAYNDKTVLNPIIAKKLIVEGARIQDRYVNSISLLHAIALLTATEYKILRMVYEGMTYEEIAKQRFVAPVTIRTQMNKILKKFDMPNAKQLINELKKTQIFDFKDNSI